MLRLNTIKLKHSKNTEDVSTVTIPVPSCVTIPLSMHMGVPCEPLVKKGDRVLTGQKIADSDAPFSVPVHASITGTVKNIGSRQMINGTVCKTIEIEADSEQEEFSYTIPQITDRESLLSAVRESGVCGLGGAGFPTHIKLNPKNNIDTLLINAAECEPYITADYRQMIEEPEKVIGGIKLIMKHLSIPETIIGIESNKPAAIAALNALISDTPEITVHTLPSSYPQGAEKVLIHSATGRITAEGELPSDQGIIVMNVSTVAFIYDYSMTGRPLIEKRITIDGTAVRKPANVKAPIGTPVSVLLDFADTDKNKIKKLIAGGPMMGACLTDIDTPVVKTSNAFLAMAEFREIKPTACIRCARCINACPMRLMPTELEKAYLRKDAAALAELKVNLCINCGACTYVCPAGRKLAETHQLAKALLPRKK
jgi:electron transport complex protein RnfC